jgi:hypothetical protein
MMTMNTFSESPHVCASASRGLVSSGDAARSHLGISGALMCPRILLSRDSGWARHSKVSEDGQSSHMPSYAEPTQATE